MKFMIRNADSIRWPNKCVTCGGNAITSYTAYGSSLAGYKFKLISHEISYYKEGISYPICQTHKNIVMVARLLYFISIISTFLFGLYSLLFIISTVTDSPIIPVSFETGLIFCVIFLISILVFIKVMNLQPVRLKDVGKHFVTIVIRNEQYAREFASLNNL